MKSLVIFDLEATCWEERTNKKNEIIEIGAVRIDKDTGSIIDKFDVFVRPRFNPVLSSFCKNLTNIKQEDVDSGYDLQPAIMKFIDWLSKYDDEYIMSWGYYDRNQIMRETTDKNIDCIELETMLTNKHVNNQFAHTFGVKGRGCGIMKALKMLQLTFDGSHHRGIDDSINIATIYKETKEKILEKIYDVD